MAGRGVNKVIIVGNLGKDPEVRYLPSGGAVAKITVATSESWKDKQSGEKQERTEWHNIEFFGRLAEIAGEYLKKGAKVYVEGSLRTDKYQDKQTGQDRYTTKIVANEMQMLDGRTGGTSSFANEDAPAAGAASPRRNQAPAPAASAGNDFDDDIPF